MGMPHRGRRVQATVRLAFDDYREVAVRARARGWSMSDYIAYCVSKELLPSSGRTANSFETNPLGYVANPTGARAAGGRKPEHVTHRTFDDG